MTSYTIGQLQDASSYEAVNTVFLKQRVLQVPENKWVRLVAVAAAAVSRYWLFFGPPDPSTRRLCDLSDVTVASLSL
jgi:hypothetical protein